MSTFSDDFERANGGLGNGWIVDYNTASLASGQAVVDQYSRVRQSTVASSGRQDIVFHFPILASAYAYVGCFFKYSHTAGNGYFFYLAGPQATPVCHIRRVTGGNWDNDLTASGSALITGTNVVRVLYDSGLITVWVNGQFIYSVGDATYGALTEAGMYATGNATKFDDWTCYSDEAVALSVEPDPIGNYGGTYAITLAGVATAWTAGTPGSPTFTVDHGTLSSQVVTSTTTATANYTPGNFLGTATFSDPSTGATCQVIVTSDTSIAPPTSGPGGMSQEVLDWLSAQAEHGGLVLADNDTSTGDVSGILIKNAFGEILLGKRTATGTGTPPAYNAAVLLSVWAGLWGGFDQLEISPVEPASDSVMYAIQQLAAVTPLLATGLYPDASALANALAGDPFTSHKTILDAVEAISSVDNQEVLDAIAAMQGDPLATIKAVLDLVYQLGTVNAYDLGTVKTWVEAVRGSGLPTIKTILDKFGSSSMTETEQHELTRQTIINMVTMQGMLDAVVTAVTGGAGDTIADVVADIAELRANMPAPDVAVPPVWPGLDGVTLGEVTALSDGLILTGPMHGVLLTITDHPVRYQGYDFGDVISWSRVGQIIFGTDRGDYERSQTFALDTQIIVPTTMQEAASAIIRLNQGWEGTVRTWVRNA